nr:cyclophilin-like fold protein [uncultured Cohaesibacter sp.]
MELRLIYAPWGNLAIFYKSFPRVSGLVRFGHIDGDLKPLLKGGHFKILIEKHD